MTAASFPTQSPAQSPQPPIAKVQPHKMVEHGNERIDNYFWLNDREDKKVIDYLNAENAYTQAVMANELPLVDKIFEETKARIKQDDSSVPYLDRGWLYYSRFETGKQYPILCRKQGSEKGAEEILLNVNELAEGHGYCAVGAADVSSKGDVLAWAEDFQGRRIYTVRFKRLSDGKILEDTIPDVTSNIEWAEDNQTLFYTRQDPQTLRSFQIYKHVLGTDASEDTLVFEEEDDTFSCYITKSRSRKYLIIGSYQTLSSEARILDAANPNGEFKVFAPREANHEYDLDHYGDHFYIRSNKGAENFQLLKAPAGDWQPANWRVIVPHDPNVLLEGFDLFENFLVLQSRSNALTHLRIVPWSNGSGDLAKGHDLDFGEPAYLAYSNATPEADTQWLRYGYTSMTTPNSVYEYNMQTKEKRLLKETEVLGDFDRKNYVTERQWAEARDGTKVPVSIVYRKDTPRDGSAPCLLYGYGSYGNSIDPTFSSSRLNLLDRGFVFAIGHIRGGQELGRQWYEDGKLLKKKNTFTDFIDVGKFLIANKYSDPQRLYGRGGSAGGLLIGAVINREPSLFHGVIADVPFVDVVTTMLDDSIPLTTSEYDEWGNPNDKTYYEYMLSYSPYDNVTKTAYPNMLVTTGLHDSQVQYWEPAKWVAKLRVDKTDDHILLLKTNMEAGHGGASGRFDRFKEVAFRHAFLLRLAGIRE